MKTKSNWFTDQHSTSADPQDTNGLEEKSLGKIYGKIQDP